MYPIMWLLVAAVVAGWIVQLYVTYQQSMAFNTAGRATLQAHGTVSVGVGGKRYRGGRAFVAIAVDDRGVVARRAAPERLHHLRPRPRPLPQLLGLQRQRAARRARDPRTFPPPARGRPAGRRAARRGTGGGSTAAREAPVP